MQIYAEGMREAEPDPVILAAFRAAGVTREDVAPFAVRHPEFAVYGPLLDSEDDAR